MKIKHRYCIVFSLLISLFAVPPTACADPDNKRYSADNRFIDNGNKTITDTRTGLMWAREDSYLATGHWMNWHEAQEYVLKLNERGFANYVDWQLPTIQELTTLFEEEKTNSSQVGSEMKIHIDPIFAQNGAGAIWSVEANGRYNAFGVVFNTGSRFNGPKNSRGRKAIRAVRQGPL